MHRDLSSADLINLESWHLIKYEKKTWKNSEQIWKEKIWKIVKLKANYFQKNSVSLEKQPDSNRKRITYIY